MEKMLAQPCFYYLCRTYSSAMIRWLFIILTLPLFGAYVGNPSDPAIMSTGLFSSTYSFFKVTSGYVGDYVSNKRYVPSDPSNNFVLKEFGTHSQLANISLILVERFELFGNFGGVKEHFKIRETVPLEELRGLFSNFRTANHIAWGAGGKVIFFQWGQTFLSGNLTYFTVPSANVTFPKWIKDRIPLNITFVDDIVAKRFSLEEWQANIALSSRFLILTPYGGLSYLRSNLYMGEDITYRNQKNLGYFYGLTLSLTGRLHFNVERRVTNEFAYAFSTIAVF
jgi:hypothetical protein